MHRHKYLLQAAYHFLYCIIHFTLYTLHFNLDFMFWITRPECRWFKSMDNYPTVWSLYYTMDPLQNSVLLEDPAIALSYTTLQGCWVLWRGIWQVQDSGSARLSAFCLGRCRWKLSWHTARSSCVLSWFESKVKQAPRYVSNNLSSEGFYIFFMSFYKIGL